MVPIRVGGCATFGSKYQQAVAIGQVHQRCCATLAALGTCRCEQEQGSTLKRPADLPSIRMEFLDDPTIPVIHVYHCPFYYWYRLRRHQSYNVLRLSPCPSFLSIVRFFDTVSNQQC